MIKRVEDIVINNHIVKVERSNDSIKCICLNCNRDDLPVVSIKPTNYPSNFYLCPECLIELGKEIMIPFNEQKVKDTCDKYYRQEKRVVRLLTEFNNKHSKYLGDIYNIYISINSLYNNEKTPLVSWLSSFGFKCVCGGGTNIVFNVNNMTMLKVLFEELIDIFNDSKPKIYPWDIFDWVKEGQTEYDGYLNLRNTDITHLPDNMTVSGCLSLYCADITHLPKSLSVFGDMSIRNTNITHLPDNLEVGGNLDIRNTNVTQLPDDLYVGDDLYIEDTNITNIPEGVFIGGRIIREKKKGLCNE